MKKSDAWVRFIFKSVRDMAPVLIPPPCIPDEMADSGERPCDMARRDLTFHKEDDTKALPSFRIIAIERRPLYPG